MSFPRSSAGKVIRLQCGRPGFNPGLGRSPGEGNSYLLQYSGLENSMDCIVHGVTESHTPLSNFHFQPPAYVCYQAFAHAIPTPTECSSPSLSSEVCNIPSTSFQTPTTIMISSPIYISNSTFLCVCLRLPMFWSNWFILFHLTHF